MLNPFRPTQHNVARRRPYDAPPPARDVRHALAPIPGYQEFTKTYEQGFRIENTGLARYELFAGENEPPDFEGSGQPVATSATLPFSWTPVLPSSGNADYYCVVRYRNEFKLESFNVRYKIIRFRSGIAHLSPISPPRDVAVYDRGSGSIQVMAKYLSIDDQPAPGDTWELYARVGADPVPGVDTPVYTGAMSFSGFASLLNRTFGAYSPGDLVHVIASAVRSSDGERESAAVVVHAIPEALDLQDGFGFGGRVFNSQEPE